MCPEDEDEAKTQEIVDVSLCNDPAQEIEFIEGEEERKAFMKSWEDSLRQREIILKEREKLTKRWMDIFLSISGSVTSSLVPFGLSFSTLFEEMRTGYIQMNPRFRSKKA